ncbi:TraB/GumN family protein [Sphingobium chlorophenolicum]|uniref:GumN family protein n=1 Tax=Sphingobium chlorophenolicum TaxID=46429 RepID=A0A081RE93_SPHCR|nr:TraB/GumN family protein [Sphingobium chlorophenolicum]KEQ53516.1 GumN family protein [Sphingobium chlorophenolicum]
MKWPNFQWLAPAMMLLGGCVVERPASARDVAARTAYVTPALWTVKDADTTIYLFGTVHVMKPGVDWFKGGVKAAFERSDELVLEIVEPEDPNALASTMAGAALARDGVKLSDRLDDGERGKYLAAMTANGLPWQAFEMFNPWMAGMALSVQPLEKLGYKSDLGAEKVLTAAARASGKKVGALETVEQQLGYFAGLPMAQQVKFLTATVEGLPNMDREFASLVAHWQGGEPNKLAAEMNESLEATPELAQVLLIQRNANWAKWIRERLDRPGTLFIAVGAGHLAGKGSVQDQLKALGVSSERVKQ